MIRAFLFLLLLPILAFAEWDQFFSENEDPTVFHHVNVITGNLNLSFQDALIHGVELIPILRTYSSSGALERSPERADHLLRGFRGGWMVQGGWNLLPHANLLIEPSVDRQAFKVYVWEPSGNVTQYAYSHKQEGTKHTIFLKPTHVISQSSGKLSNRTNPQNNLLRIDLEAGVAVLFLPDGGNRTYRGLRLHHYNNKDAKQYFYLLDIERLPNGHQLRCLYEKKTTHLKKIESTNPAGNKVYGAIEITYFASEKHKPFQLTFTASDGKQFHYRTTRHEDREYINELQSNFRPLEKYNLVPGRKGIGARLASVDIGGKEPFKVEYHFPANTAQERKWAEKPEQKEFHIDKVKKIIAPVGSAGEEIAIANFEYYPGRTDVRDAEGLLIRYHHNSERLTLIEYFDEKNQPRSSQKFYWEGTQLRCKAMFDEKQQPLFAKTFAYEGGDVVKEILWGYFTGNETKPLQIDSEGNPSGAESYQKTYSYYKDHLLKTETEEEGPTYEYFYKPDTDLCTAKLTKNKEGEILIRDFSFYDNDNLLIREILDNGISADSDNKSEVAQRHEKRYERNPASGLPESIIEFYWDPSSKTEKPLKKTKYTYLNQRVHTEEVFDAAGDFRYKMTTEYYGFGPVKSKTTPLGRTSTYHYNTQGDLDESKEVGSSKKTFAYDKANRLKSCEEPDTGKTLITSYDAKGRILSQTDFRSNETVHTYDFFGNRKTTELPECQDEVGQRYKPIPEFDYDVQGNLILAKMPLKETIQTSYNLFRKPILIIQADGTQIHHFYNRNGTLDTTLYPDGTEVHYGYDLFQRMTSKTIYSKEKKVLLSENWKYSSFQLRSHTDIRGLTTKFDYNGAGRKISEEAKNRKVTFTYDLLGFLEKTDNGVIALVQKHDVEGLIEEQWEESADGKIENHMKFFYDSENRKEKAIRITSQGEATDLFSYKDGKLSSHTDPNKAITTFIYNEFFENEFEQYVLQKTTIDPLGISTIETHDAGERLVRREKKDAGGQTAFKEEFFYDRSGNQAKRVSYIYKDGKQSKQISTTWKYDTMGRIKEEAEGQQKTTSYEYDSRGRLEWKTLPSGIRLHYTYDGADRLNELESSDRKIHYRYSYEIGPDPDKIFDLVQGMTLERKYNLFGQLILETDCRGLSSKWDYDTIGRCTSYNLPDGSSIHYPTQGAHMKAVQRKDPNGVVLYEHCYCIYDCNGHVAEENLIFNLGTVKTAHDLFERPSSQTYPQMEHSISYGLSGLVKQTHNSLFGEKLYDYDALNQLKEEGGQSYHFDSLGNPTQFEINDLNQISNTPECTLTYDSDGNSKEKIFADGAIQYQFDSLGRLIEITTPQKRKVVYFYDPLSRLFAKQIYCYTANGWQEEQKIFYLYNRDQEIGTQDEKGIPLELKVLGLGIRGDIGAAVAIEIKGVVYAPLHDFNGNIVALLSSDGKIVEKYEIDAFGKEKASTYLSPWRFSSKRSEEGLVFFGLRFYDPSLGRWLSPDPAGFADGANLYVYVQNSPLNRLDLFGLVGEPFSVLRPCEIIVPIWSIPTNSSLFSVKMLENGIYVDYFLSCGHWHELNLTPHEKQRGNFNLFHHGELMAVEGGKIGLVSFTHGVNVQWEEFRAASQYMIDVLPAGTLFIGRYYGTDGFWKDALGAGKELFGIETIKVCQARQFLIACSQILHKVNPAIFDDSGNLMSFGALWAHYDHSRGGVIDLRAVQGMPYEQQKTLQTQLLLTSIAPANPIPEKYGLKIINYYSKQDGITGGLGAPHIPASIFGVVGSLGTKSYFGHNNCDIRFVPCISKWSERSLYFADHAFLGGTYRETVAESVRQNNENYGFYNGKNR